ncbi:MAG: 2-oxoglutarate dehydrogenase E1 component [Terrimicrobiaceae bacterium]|nr:2-oxoglutarate dehydrogenase E1 component [Terrimicrobiaceae bacterium]
MNNSLAARSNEALIDENYQQWLKDPRSVGNDWAAFFEGFELGYSRSERNGTGAPDEPSPDAIAPSLQTRVDALVYAYRTMGHSIAHLDPLSEAAPENPLLSLRELGFSEKDLDLVVSSRFFRDDQKMTVREMIAELRTIYCDTLGVEFMHIQNPKVRNWVRDRIENRRSATRNDPAVHRDILLKLYEAETFESFIHTKYVGQKRFSLEGGESLILALNTILDNCGRAGVKEIVMGMAHRGRLNVLANFLNKPLSMIFNEFQDNFVPELVGGNGDVKYHLGYQTVRKIPDGTEVEIRLAANPSHLEAVDPVVQGKARARQRIVGDTETRKKVVPILVHGDAAFIGQGVVQEVFNMSQLPGYRTGGTIHIIVNNQIGFTTSPDDGRSTHYCTDIAKMIEAPIFHVNGEDPLTVLEVAQLALDFRQEFGRDVVIDIYGYRRHGHNETDEPSFTQPDLYSRIKTHELLSEKFARQAGEIGTVNPQEAAAIKAEALRELEEALADAKKPADARKKSEFAGSTAIFQPPYSHEPVNTAISERTLEQVVTALTTVPEGFRVVPKLRRTVLERRLQIWKAGQGYDWGFAEALAFGSLLLEGTPVRLSGQDSRRGTFSHRNSVLYDEVTRERYIPLMNIAEKQERFCVYNSPLSEYAVLGFDYGYSMDFPSMLCIWEAQFGDFANGAQIIIDQFIASAESKWRRPSSIVMLLPHGYEGQGPEHSSARLERFLQLCAEDNMQVCNLTTPAQYFHVLRRQIHRGYRKPLIIMTPKSLLRAEEAASKTEDFTNSRFFEILDDATLKSKKKVERILFCSGKVYYDLVKGREEAGQQEKTAIIRIEQLYPLYGEKLQEIVQSYPNAKRFVWCQEEHANMGGWAFVAPRIAGLIGSFLGYAGRAESASTATGSLSAHKAQQAALVKQAFEV